MSFGLWTVHIQHDSLKQDPLKFLSSNEMVHAVHSGGTTLHPLQCDDCIIHVFIVDA